MKKFFVALGLLIIIALSFGFVYFKIQAQGPLDNYFNMHMRFQLAKSRVLRSALGLHDVGDGRFDYLGRSYKKIKIEVDVMDSEEMQISALDMLKDKIQAVTGKPTTYIISDHAIPFVRELNHDKVIKIVNQYQDYKSGGDTAVVYLLYASRDQDQPDTLGKTNQEDGIVLYGDKLHEFTASEPQVLPQYEESTALHEFGHLLGLSHNDEPGCLMNERAEQSHTAQARPEAVITDFCTYEKSVIESY